MRVQTAFKLDPFTVTPGLNQMTGPMGVVDLEPQVMDLLVLLVEAHGEVRSKEEIAAALWPEAQVNEDALSRTVWKLRQALGDDAKSPRYVQTVTRRGYRLIAPVVWEDPGSRPVQRLGLPAYLVLGLVIVGLSVWLGVFWLAPLASDTQVGDEDVLALLRRADGFYAQYDRPDNEAALRLYERVLETDPENAAALAGQANALTQRVIRWGLDGQAGRTTLTEALESGVLQTPTSRAALERAEALAVEATRLDPGHARAWRALGLIKAAQSEFEAARSAYDRALVINPEDWGTMINLSELEALSGRTDRQTELLARSFEAMARDYDLNPVAIRPWHSAVGLSVARLHLEAGEPQQAELWYRRVLALDPLNADAVTRLAELLRAAGDEQGADALCRELAVTSGEGC